MRFDLYPSICNNHIQYHDACGNKLMSRYDYGATGSDFLNASDDDILGSLAKNSQFNIKLSQRSAWLESISDLRTATHQIQNLYIFLEFTIPRMGKRVDAIIAYSGCIFVIEYKVGAAQFSNADIDQVLSYALDLKNFHEPSHHIPIIPVLIATEARSTELQITTGHDLVCNPILAGKGELSKILKAANEYFKLNLSDPLTWANGQYKPTPTIIEAAQALYRNHNVEEITRNEAGAENLSATAAYVSRVIEDAKVNGAKAICFITGVPGAGKTLAGLNIANIQTKLAEDDHAVFLSGNGPLVKVLQSALIRDQKVQAKINGIKLNNYTSGKRSVTQFVQNIHHFRDTNLDSSKAPVEKIAIFDEAQRAWDKNQTKKFMKRRGIVDFEMSEPQFLISVMDRHKGWCVIVCLVGHGQEINTGEAGLSEWFNACQTQFPSWHVHASRKLIENPNEFGIINTPRTYHVARELHLATSIRSFRSEVVSDFIAAIIENNSQKANNIYSSLGKFKFVITRDLTVARDWLKLNRRGTERSGILAFSNAIRLKADGVFVKNEIDPISWFLNDRSDTRSSDYLEDVATEFAVQGLELDWTCVCIDANIRSTRKGLTPMSFKGTKWQAVKDLARRQYILNAHRVLLTRARQGVIIYLPKGDIDDPTRNPVWYDGLFEYFKKCGIEPI